MESPYLSRQTLLGSQILEPDHLAVRGIDEGDAEFSEGPTPVWPRRKTSGIPLGLLEHIHGSDLNLLALHAGDSLSLMKENIVGRTFGSRVFLNRPMGA
jgi:hypothetical protein